MKGIILILAFLSASCGPNQASFSLLSTGQTFKQSGSLVNSKVDVLWVIDNSGSMSPSQQNILNNFSSFMNNFIAKGLDYQMAVTTTEAYKAGAAFANDPTYSLFKDGATYTKNNVTYNQHTGINLIYPGVSPDVTATFVINAFQGDQGSGDERAFSSFLSAVENPQNPVLIRKDSYFAVIILSDEDDFSSATRVEGDGTDHNYDDPALDSVQSYVSALDSLTNSTDTLKHYNVSAIAVKDADCQKQLLSTNSSTSIIGERYIDLVTQTNGVVGSICDPNFAGTLNNIQEKILELSTEFYLERAPNVATVKISVNSVAIAHDDTNGWSYDSANNGILFHGTAIPPQGADIIVNFDPISIK